jgi:predicted DCC family thiol-disulfide oxidoreductase YuxK
VKTYAVVRFVAGAPDPAERTFDRPWTVIYDGACKVCGRLATGLRKWDRANRITVVPSQTPGVRAHFPWIPDRAYRESVQLVGPGGQTFQGAAAIEKLLDLVPRGRWLTWVFSIPFVRPLAEKAYRWFARHRYRFGCGQHCQSRPLDVVFDDEDAPVTPS